MKQDVFSNGARDRPLIPDEEKIQLSKDRRIANRARAEAGFPDTAFRQAKKADRFAAREDAFSSDPDSVPKDKSKSSTTQKDRIRRSYAKDIRKELGTETAVDPSGEGGIRTKMEGRAGSVFHQERTPSPGSMFKTDAGTASGGQFFSEDSLPKSSSFFIEEEPAAAGAGKISGRHLTTHRFQKTAEVSMEGIRETVGDTILSDQDADPASAKTVRTGYGAARLGTSEAAKAMDRSPTTVRKTVIDQKASAFYSSEEGRAAGEAARKKAAKELQRHLIRKNYQTAPESVIYIPIVSRIRERARTRSGQTLLGAGKSAAIKIAEFFEQHPMVLIALIISGILTTLIGAAISGGATLITHTLSPSTLATSYTAEDADIKGAESDYRAMEAALSSKITDLENNYPGYSTYGLSGGQVGHNPYQLAALLTVLHENYTQEDVQNTLQKIFDIQYNLSMHDEAGSVERKAVRVGQSLGSVVTSAYCSCEICCGQWSGGPTASGVMPTPNHTIAVDAYSPFVPMGTKVVMNGIEYTVEDTGAFAQYGVAFDVYYSNHAAAQAHGHQTWEAYIADDNGSQEVEVMVSSGSQQFTAVIQNNGLDYVADKLLTKDEKERYDLLVETKGNKPELFVNDIYTGGGAGWFDYTIAGNALSDQKFANMMAEATKYLRYPYVWGGSSPETSFDCSGFVCWVINHSGNGWNVGRTTADGLCSMLPKVPLSEAKPGDIIFFQGTYDTAGASHVGIIVGDGVMLHCGEPIQYAQYNTPYYQQHFYCVGRLPG